MPGKEREARLPVVTVDAEGSITLDESVLTHLGAVPGSRLIACKLPDGAIELRVDRRSGKISKVFGILKREGQRPVSIEEMNEAIEAGWAGEV
jgi:antitoxin PrlF